MELTSIFAQIMGIKPPWRVKDVVADLKKSEITVSVRHSGGDLQCPECGKKCPGYGSQARRWRDLDTCQLRTMVEVEVPRIECPEHGKKMVSVPWAEDISNLQGDLPSAADMFARRISDTPPRKKSPLMQEHKVTENHKKRLFSASLKSRADLAALSGVSLPCDKNRGWNET